MGLVSFANNYWSVGSNGRIVTIWLFCSVNARGGSALSFVKQIACWSSFISASCGPGDTVGELGVGAAYTLNNALAPSSTTIEACMSRLLGFIPQYSFSVVYPAYFRVFASLGQVYRRNQYCAASETLARRARCIGEYFHARIYRMLVPQPATTRP